MSDEIIKPKTWIQIQNEPVKELKKLDLKLAASRRIRSDAGLTMFSITGKQQGGKSSYAMLILNEIYNGDEDEVMRHIVFTIKDFTKLISDAINGGYRERCIVWDDQSISGGAAKWVVDPKAVMYLAGLGDSLGVSTKSVILTSPSGDMTKSFRNYTKYKVIISTGRHEFDRVARGYWLGKSPMDQRYCSLEFQDNYDTRIPFYERYAEIRKKISLMAIKNLNDAIDENGNINNTQIISNKPQSIKDKVFELYRDYKAGVYAADMTFKQLCISHKINYGTARNYI